MVIWVHPNDCIPPHSLDLLSAHDREKVELLAQAFSEFGFDERFPALVGYPLEGKIQLLSGTHRHLALILTDKFLPVTPWRREEVEEAWGTEKWSEIIEDISVEELKDRLDNLRRERNGKPLRN